MRSMSDEPYLKERISSTVCDGDLHFEIFISNCEEQELAFVVRKHIKHGKQNDPLQVNEVQQHVLMPDMQTLTEWIESDPFVTEVPWVFERLRNVCRPSFRS